MNTQIDVEVLNDTKNFIDNSILYLLDQRADELEDKLNIISSDIQGYDLSEVVSYFNTNTRAVINHIKEGMTELSSYLGNKIDEVTKIMAESDEMLNKNLDLLNSLNIENN
jgi:hypothetical protein